MAKYYLGRSREEIPSRFGSGNVYEGQSYKNAAIKMWGNEFLDKYAAISIWEEAYKKNIEYFVVSSNHSVSNRLPLGIAYEFKKIKNVAHVKNFAAKYGTLGIENLTTDEIDLLTGLKLSHTGIVSVEPIEFWYDCAKKIRCIISLYDALQISFKQHSELDLDCEPIPGNNNSPIAYRYSWIYNDGTKEDVSLSIVVDPPSLDLNTDEIIKYNSEIGMKILIQAIKPFIRGKHTDVDEELFPNENSCLGFEIIEHKCTNSLLTAIFYDLWFLLVSNVQIGRCIKCNKPFIQLAKGRPRKTCSDSCRVGVNKRKKGLEA